MQIKAFLSAHFLSIFAFILIIYLSFFTPPSLPKLSKLFELDKVAHLCMYFGFMSILVFEFRNNLTRKKLFFLALFSCALGGIIEILQGTLTSYRSPSLFDFIANTSGIVLCVLATIIIKSIHNRLFNQGK